MAEVFLGFHPTDEPIVRVVAQHLALHEVSVSLAQVNTCWGQKTLETVAGAGWAFLIVTRDTCSSPWVQHGSLGGPGLERLVPLIWNVPSEQRPPWIQGYPGHRVDLTGVTLEDAFAQVVIVAAYLGSDPNLGTLVVGQLLAGHFCSGLVRASPQAMRFLN
jgi:hypothetical protein